MSDRPRYVGQRVKRTEDARLVRGQARYVDDIRLPETLHVAFVRSPHAHARVRGIDRLRASGTPGVRAVVTAADLEGGVAAMRSDTMDALVCRQTEWPALARDRVRYVGEAVAAVVASDRYAAEDGAALVDVAYDPLPAVVDVDDALAIGAPRLHDEWPDNVLMRTRGGGGDVAAAFADAPLVLGETFSSEAVTGVALEARACLAAVDEGTGVLTLWSSHQTPHVLRSLVAEHLGHPEHLLRVICPDMGGGFGIKTHLYPEDLVVAFLALRLRRPVKWVQTRREDFLASNYCREHRISVDVAADGDGRLRGLRARIVMNGGAYSILPGFGSMLEATGAARQLLGPYRVPAYEYEASSVVTNKVPRGAYRGVAMVTTTFTMERVMDLIAARTGLDRAEVRRRNLISAPEFPYTNALGIVVRGRELSGEPGREPPGRGLRGLSRPAVARASRRPPPRPWHRRLRRVHVTQLESAGLAWHRQGARLRLGLAAHGPERQGARVHEHHGDGAGHPDGAGAAHRRRARRRSRRRQRRDRRLHAGPLRERRLREPRRRGGRRRRHPRRAPGPREDRRASPRPASRRRRRTWSWPTGRSR